MNEGQSGVTSYKIQPTGDDQYEAIVTSVTTHNRSKVFPTHDEAEEWAQSEVQKEDESDEEITGTTSVDATAAAGDSSEG